MQTYQIIVVSSFSLTHLNLSAMSNQWYSVKCYVAVYAVYDADAAVAAYNNEVYANDDADYEAADDGDNASLFVMLLLLLMIWWYL